MSFIGLKLSTLDSLLTENLGYCMSMSKIVQNKKINHQTNIQKKNSLQVRMICRRGVMRVMKEKE